ncbi:MAG: cysteine desulfurase [Chthonomonadales bacterium]|nr:cysteine desulfurase [Chthonomonadales bacterium]
MIYLDHAATTPLAPEALEAMLPYLREAFGNASSIHEAGREARAAVDAARDAVAGALRVDYAEVYFTSGGTEADNLAVLGAARAAPPGRRHIVVSAAEHHAVLHSAAALERQGFVVDRVAVDGDGRVDPDEVARAVTSDTALVSVMHANNEVGAINDITRVAAIAREHDALTHTDAVQSFGAVPVDARALGVDLLSVSAHKLGGPKGVGALYVRAGTAVEPLMYGGSQEREKRPGTESVAAIVGFGRAVEVAEERRAGEAGRLASLRDRFVELLQTAIPGLRLNGPSERRLPNNVNVSIAGIDGAAALMALDRAGIAASSGSACSSGSIEPSHVLMAMGLPADLASSSLRFTLGRSTTWRDLEGAASALAGIAARLRGAA